jgi:hypothetical protein
MAVTAKYEAPLQVVETAEMRGRIVAISDAEKISQAQVIREILADGIAAREELSRERLAVGAPEQCDLQAGTHVTPHRGCIMR